MAPAATRKAEKDPTVVAPDADASAASVEGADVEAPTQQTPKASSGTEYLNVTQSVLRYDNDGHLVGAGEWTPPINLDAIGKAARASEFLLPRSAL